ncbi:MAG: anti-sigma regulatory factor [Actinobacteria bacterium]|nr:MAG: anti-sigma regulatory factor [Actinomycetota bacterium]
MDHETCVEIESDADMVAARAAGRALAERLGFSRTDGTLIATAISEVARNILVHAGCGEILLHDVHERDRHGIVVVARDCGPGIQSVELALQDGWGSSGGLGLGLPGARRLMDEFTIESVPGDGTTVTMKKWRARDPLERLRREREQREQVWA